MIITRPSQASSKQTNQPICSPGIMLPCQYLIVLILPLVLVVGVKGDDALANNWNHSTLAQAANSLVASGKNHDGQLNPLPQPDSTSGHGPPSQMETFVGFFNSLLTNLHQQQQTTTWSPLSVAARNSDDLSAPESRELGPSETSSNPSSSPLQSTYFSNGWKALASQAIQSLYSSSSSSSSNTQPSGGNVPIPSSSSVEYVEDGDDDNGGGSSPDSLADESHVLESFVTEASLQDVQTPPPNSANQTGSNVLEINKRKRESLTIC